VASLNTDPLTGAALTAANAWLDGGGLLPGRTVSVSFPDGGQVHQRVYESYFDGTFVAWDNYGIDVEGRVSPAAGFGGAVSGPVFRQGLLGSNLEQVVTATELGERSIDLMIAPRFLTQAGLLR